MKLRKFTLWPYLVCFNLLRILGFGSLSANSVAPVVNHQWMEPKVLQPVGESYMTRYSRYPCSRTEIMYILNGGCQNRCSYFSCCAESEHIHLLILFIKTGCIRFQNLQCFKLEIWSRPAGSTSVIYFKFGQKFCHW